MFTSVRWLLEQPQTITKRHNAALFIVHATSIMIRNSGRFSAFQNTYFHNARHERVTECFGLSDGALCQWTGPHQRFLMSNLVLCVRVDNKPTLVCFARHSKGCLQSGKLAPPRRHWATALQKLEKRHFRPRALANQRPREDSSYHPVTYVHHMRRPRLRRHRVLEQGQGSLGG